MKYVKLFSALVIIMAVALAPSSIAFAQSNVNADVNADVNVNTNTAETKDRQIYKEQKQVRDQIKEQRQNIKTQLNDLRDLRNDRLSEKTDVNVVPSLEFSGKVTGWAVIGGKAVPTTFELSGEAGKVDQRGWKISGTADAKIGDRNVTFDLQGFARGNHVVLKGTTNEFDSVVVQLNGYFAPIAGDDDSFALAFHRSAIINEQANIRIPLVLVGQVDTTPIGDAAEPTDADSVDVSVELSALFN